MGRIFTISLLSVVMLSDAHSMIMRNNALMSRMISKFQGKDINNRPATEPPQTEDNKGNVVALMQNVLCKNFPTIPCEIITNDATLRHLIEKSIRQLKVKKVNMDKSTIPPSYQLTLFPVVNSEDLSNFVQVSETGFFKSRTPKPRKKQTKQKKASSKNYWSHEKQSVPAVINGRKKLRKFYPHKIKYKDKNEKRDYTEYSDEKLSMSVEIPRVHTADPAGKRKHFSYRGDPSDPPVWRIDYMKHGEPSLNMFGYEADGLKGKIIKSGPGMIVDEHLLEQAVRKDVLHPDVYIKKNYLKKKGLDGNSEAYD